jgi:hypothetical protein
MTPNPERQARLPPARADDARGTRRSVTDVAKRVGDLRPLLGVLLFVVYLVVRGAYSRFYGPLGLSPDEIGVGYVDLLAQSAIGAVALPLVVLLLVSMATVLPLAGIELSHLSLPKTAAAFVGVVGVIVLSQIQEAPAQWVFAVGVAGLFVISINGIRKRLASERTVRGRPEGSWWRAALVISTITALLLAAADLLREADRAAELVKRGIPAHLVLDRVRLTSWGAEAATLSWTATPVDPALRALSAACLMYLGQSGETLFLYTPNQPHPATFRIPASTAVIRIFPDARCQPGIATPTP